ncbi:MAG: hypothetical protein HC849_27720 [Oscillatoriales cyanobacterium RU_3_3]|nr:hypothetical protein [Oscillatoriales cyanobacterium RU_3_3]
MLIANTFAGGGAGAAGSQVRERGHWHYYQLSTINYQLTDGIKRAKTVISLTEQFNGCTHPRSQSPCPAG